MTTFVQDLRYGLRILLKSPGFTAVGVLTLALGIGMATAIFSVVYGVLLKPLAYEQPDRIVELRELNAQGRPMRFADQNFDDVRGQARSLQGVAEYDIVELSVSGGAEPTRTSVSAVSQDFLGVMRVRPAWGRGFRPEDARFGAAPVALVGEGFWKQYLGGARDLSSAKLKIDDKIFSVVGVLPARFSYPPRAEIWVPREIYEHLPTRTAHNWSVVARLRDGVSLPQASAELQTIAQRLKQQYGQDTMMVGVKIAPLRDALTNDVRPALWVLFGAVGLLLLIACANVANLLLVQSAARRHEIAIRYALGATRGRVVRQLISETLLLSLAGGALGVLAAFWGVQALLALSPDVLPRMEEVSISIPVLVFSAGLCAAVAFALGVFSGLRSSDGVQQALAAGGRSNLHGVSQRMSRGIVAGQLAITVVLLAGAALLGRSLLRVLSVNPGFRTEHILAMNLALPSTAPDAAPQRVQFLNELFTRLRAIPGVQDVGATSNLPLTGFHPDGAFVVMNSGEALPSDERQLEQMFHDKSRTGDADYAAVNAAYFHVLGIPLLRGRLFNASDTLDTPHVAVISESVARERWPGQDPLGHQIEFGNMDGDLRLLTVVGVVGEVRAESLERPPFPAVYVNCLQRPAATSDLKVVISTGADTAAVTTAARQIMRDLDPDVPPHFATLDELVAGSVQARRFNLMLVGVFAATALLLAMAGIYGVMAYSVARRTNEIGIRMALGAGKPAILRLVLGQGLVTAAAGVGAGVLAALAATRTLQSLLYGLSATDPATFAAVALLLVAVALLASYLPARRATQVDPMVALRYD